MKYLVMYIPQNGYDSTMREIEADYWDENLHTNRMEFSNDKHEVIFSVQAGHVLSVERVEPKGEG